MVAKLLFKTGSSQAISVKNLFTSSACSIILWMHADDAMKPLKCMSKLSMMRKRKLKEDQVEMHGTLCAWLSSNE